jgi:arginyl-tRNA synthetase
MSKVFKVHFDTHYFSLEYLTSSNELRYTLAHNLKPLILPINDAFLLAPKIIPNPKDFLTSLKIQPNVYQASMSRQFAADLPSDIEQTTLKDEPKDWYIKTADFGDTHDRPLQHRSGEYTQLLEDLSVYHQILQDHCDRIIILRPHDYGGYDVLINAAMRCLGYSAAQFQFIIVQPLKLYAFHQPTQKVQPIPDLPIQELQKAVSLDACRWYSLRVPLTEPAPLNLSIASKSTPGNSLYQVQSAHARCCDFLRTAKANNLIKLLDENPEKWHLEETVDPQANSDEASQLLQAVQDTESQLEKAAADVAPHYICQHLERLSRHCHHWLSTTEPTLNTCQIALQAKNTIHTLLKLLEISAPVTVPSVAVVGAKKEAHFPSVLPNRRE